MFNKGRELAAGGGTGTIPGEQRRGADAEADLPPVSPGGTDDPHILWNANAAVRQLCKSVQTFQKATAKDKRLETLAQMHDQIQTLNSLLTMARLDILAALGTAIGKLFTTFSRDLEAINPSSLRTVSHAIDLLSKALANPSFKLPRDTSFRVLVVDDHAVCRHALSMALHSSPLKLTVCESGPAALEILKDSAFDAVFTDIMMPGMDGFAMVAELRKLPTHARTPVIYVTALCDFKTRAKSVLSGGCDIIAKPFSPSEIVIKALTIGLKQQLEHAALSAAAAEPKGTAKFSRPATDRATPRPIIEPLTRPPKPLCPARAVVCIEPHGRITSANRDAHQILGFSPGELTGENLHLILPDALQDQTDGRTVDSLLQETPLPQGAFRMTGRHKDQSTIPLLASFSETKTQGRRALVCLLRRNQPAPAEAPGDDPTPQDHEQTAHSQPAETPAEAAVNDSHAGKPIPTTAPQRQAEPNSSLGESNEDPVAEMADRIADLENQLAVTRSALLEAQASRRSHPDAGSPSTVTPPPNQDPLAPGPAILAEASRSAGAEHSLDSERKERQRLEHLCARQEADLRHLQDELHSRKSLEECLRRRELDLQKQLEQETERARLGAGELLKARAELRLAHSRNEELAALESALRREIAQLQPT